MKKIFSLLLAILIFFTFGCVYAQDGSDTTVYSADGTAKTIEMAQLDEHLKNNWFLWPVVTIYREDGATSVVYESDAETHLANGWYLYPVTTIYAPYGRTSVVYTADVNTHLENGWYLSPEDFPKKEKAVALTYDDGPSRFTPQILDCLEKYGAKATFFVVGRSVNAYPNTLRRAFDLGMEIGNHTMNHSRLTSISLSSVSAEINSTAQAVQNITGTPPKLVRPPYGSYNKSVMSTAGLPFILWSIDTLDWKTRNAEKTINAVLNDVSDGDIILMHDLYLPTVQATKVLVPALLERGFDLVTVSELAERKNVNLDSGAFRQFK